ncbi:MAG: DUF4097 domain-containing protein [Eubacterium sp.]|nr:DUF4097 domain-containing protein [Eubacterium sp.]MDE6155485.1 DUF4097 domain-containing protein [Eubacterium sp.]MDE6767410.1 DUF4097 domain-containing protein [Eubacterium sp.]
MTKNNKGLIITVIALLSIIVLLLTGFMGYVIFTNGSHLDFSDWNRESKVIYDESFDSTDISKMIITSELGDIDIKQSNDDKIRVVANGYDEKLFKLTNEGNTITVNSTTSYHKTKVFNPFGNYRNIGIDIDIYLPSGCLEKLDISSDLGDVDIESSLDIDLTVNCDMGNITAENLSGKFALHTDMGDIEIERINITADSSATSDMGDIEVEHTNDIKINYSTSMGECDVKNNNSLSDIMLTAKTSMGDIEIG